MPIRCSPVSSTRYRSSFLCSPRLTDWLDGWLARKFDAVTPLGAALDHVADKVLVACALVALAYAALPLHLVIAAVIILGRDIAIAGLREGISAQGGSLPVSQLRKMESGCGNGWRLCDAGVSRRRAPANIDRHCDGTGLGRAHPDLGGGGARPGQRGALCGDGAAQSRASIVPDLVGPAELDRVQQDNGDEKSADGDERGHENPQCDDCW